MIIHGDCLTAMAAMEPESIDAICTDPPYGLEFMGKEWDKLTSCTCPMEWAGMNAPSRGHRAGCPATTVTGGAGFSRPGIGERETAWVSPTGSPNPMCRNCGGSQRGNDRKGFRRCRCDRPDFPNHGAKQGAAMQSWHQRWAEAAYRVAKPSAYLLAFGGTRTVHRMTVALEDAGWIIRDMLVWAYASGFPKSKASLKPAWEPIVMARKPGPLRMLAIDECRIPTDEIGQPRGNAESRTGDHGIYGHFDYTTGSNGSGATSPLGRWPANVILTDPIFDGGVEGVVGGGETSIAPRQPAGYRRSDASPWSESKGMFTPEREWQPEGYGDSGTYSRFFLIPKADRSDREPVLGGLPLASRGTLNEYARPSEGRTASKNGSTPRANVHPTVKPTELMRHLVRLVTPTGGTILDPFLGSGTTGLACELEGFPWIGIEKEAEYVAIAEARLNGTQRGLGLDVPAPTPRVPKTHPDLSKHQPKQRAPGENWSGRWAGTEPEEVA